MSILLEACKSHDSGIYSSTVCFSKFVLEMIRPLIFEDLWWWEALNPVLSSFLTKRLEKTSMSSGAGPGTLGLQRNLVIWFCEHGTQGAI